MAYLANPVRTTAVLKAYDFKFSKKYGQNFLIDANIVSSIVDAAEITDQDVVLEIGPGIGTMTQYLCERAAHVIAVEIDKTLIPILEHTLEDYDNVDIINEDVLKVDFMELSDLYASGGKLAVVANLPYYITTPIIFALLEKTDRIKSITVMIQKEVADRIAATPGTKDYGALSLAVGYYSRASLALNVSRHCFMPKPNVDSAVIHMKIYGDSVDRPIAKNEAGLFKVIRASFNQRRKTLANGLGNSGEVPISKGEAAEMLKRLGFDSSIRGEKLSLGDFITISDEIFK